MSEFSQATSFFDLVAICVHHLGRLGAIARDEIIFTNAFQGIYQNMERDVKPFRKDLYEEFCQYIDDKVDRDPRLLESSDFLLAISRIIDTKFPFRFPVQERRNAHILVVEEEPRNLLYREEISIYESKTGVSRK